MSDACEETDVDGSALVRHTNFGATQCPERPIRREILVLQTLGRYRATTRSTSCRTSKS